MSIPKAVEELSFETIKTRKVNKLKQIIPTIANQLVDSDPAIALLEESSYTEGLLRNRINNSINAVMLDYASGSDLDNLGKLYGIERKLIQEEDNSTVPPTPAVWESDEELRKRIMEAPKGFSVAGPKASYIYYGKLADSKVKDISAVSNTPMEVDITVLSYDGNGEASSDLINKVYTKLNAEEIRPMGDLVRVKGVAIVDFSIDLQIVFKAGNVVDKDAIIEEIKNNLQAYVNSEHKLEGFISQAGIYSSSFIETIEDVIMIAPLENIKCTPAQAPYCSEIKVTEQLENTNQVETPLGATPQMEGNIRRSNNNG